MTTGWIDMSWNIVDENSFFLNTTIDRLWLDLNFNKFQARIGRQRINWGQTFVWNPNDIFNAYSFFDFDYTERPGSDAIRLQYYPSFSSAIELAAKIDSEKMLPLQVYTGSANGVMISSSLPGIRTAPILLQEPDGQAQ